MDFLFDSGRMMESGPRAYCGPPPPPEALISAWNFDPWLIAGLIALAIAYLRVRPSRAALQKDAAFWCGLAVLAVAFVSPLCALTVSLFSARVVHHALLVAIVAPLLVSASQAVIGFMRGVPLSAMFIAHTAVFWIWHAPVPYALALSSDGVYWLMQATLFFSAAGFWAKLMMPNASRASAVAGCFGSILQMGMLGALFTFADTPLQAPHALTTFPFGLTPLEDQQLAGLIMWVPASAPYLIFALYKIRRMLEVTASAGESRA